MHLEVLGFDEWFREKSRALAPPGFSAARVTRVDRDRYLVRNEHDEVQAEATGKLMFAAESVQDLPCVGDWVVAQYHNDGQLAIIHDVLPRKSFLRRKAPGTKVDYQMIAANVDAAFLMQSVDLNFNVRRLERYLVMVREGHVEPIIVLSKSDLLRPDELEAKTAEIRNARIGAHIVTASSQSESGLQAVRQLLQPGKTYCLLGSSGVGKTTLLNHLLGRDAFDTQPVRDKDDRGRHTTSRRQLTVLEQGALLVDTPGLRELGLIAVGDTIDESFADISMLSQRCRFNDCSHSVETGCAVLDAVQRGELSRDRYQSFMKLLKESAFHEMTYVERRKKDKEFGRMVKSVTATLKKRKPSG